MGQCNQETLKVRERDAAEGITEMGRQLEDSVCCHRLCRQSGVMSQGMWIPVETRKGKGCGFSLEPPDGEAPC